MQNSEVFLQPQRHASAAAAPPYLFAYIQNRSRAEVRLEAIVRRLFTYSSRPLEAKLFLRMKPPYSKPSVRNANKCSGPLGLCIKLSVTEHATNKNCSFVLFYVEIYQTVARMAQMSF